MGKSPLTGGGSHGHKQRRVGDYLLFKQIAGLCGRGWKGPWTSLHFWCLKVPARALAVLLRNNELSGQNSLWIPGWTASGDAEPFCWLVSRHAEHSPGSGCLGGSGDCQAAAQLTQISFVENYLMCVRPLLSIQTTENIYCCSSSQEMHISVPPPTPYSLTFTVSSIPQTIFTIFHINVIWMIDATSAIKNSWLLLVVGIEWQQFHFWIMFKQTPALNFVHRVGARSMNLPTQSQRLTRDQKQQL